MNLHTKAKSVLLAASLAIGLPAMAAGPGQSQTVSVNVTFYDLDVETLDGAKELYSRLQRASRKACDLRAPGITSVQAAADARRCYERALNVAVEKIGSEPLQLIHAS